MVTILPPLSILSCKPRDLQHLRLKGVLLVRTVPQELKFV